MIAIEAVRYNSDPNLKVILINPMIESPNRQLEIGLNLGSRENDFSLPVNVSTLASNGMKLSKKVTSGNLLIHFFPAADLDMDLPTRLSKPGLRGVLSREILVFIGEFDELSSSHSRRLMANIAFARVFVISGMSHRINAFYANRMSELLSEFSADGPESGASESLVTTINAETSP